MYHKTVNFSKILSPVQQLSLSYNSCHHLLGSQSCYCSCVFVHPVQELREENTALRKELADARQEPIPPSPLPLSPTFHLSSYLQMLRKFSSIPQTCKCLLKGCVFVRVLTRFLHFSQVPQWAAASWGSFREVYREESALTEVTNHSTWETGVCYTVCCYTHLLMYMISLTVVYLWRQTGWT